MYKSFKVRLYPTKEQEQLMLKHIGCCRFIWNYMLDLQIKRHENGEKHLSRFDMIKLLTPLKKEEKYMWLKEISNTSLQIICTDLSKAYNTFFQKTTGFPKFKSRKKNKQTFPVRYDAIWFDGEFAHIEKIGKVKYKSDNDLPVGRGTKIINPRVANINGKWILSLLVECENQAQNLTDRPMGIDLGVKETMTVAFGNECIVFHNINKSKTIRILNQKLKHLQKTISRKYEANKQGKRHIKTNNIIRAEEKLRKLYARLKNIRHNYIHQSTHKLVSLLPCRIVMEDLNVSGMMKSKHETIYQIQYKCEWNNIPFYQVGRFYPSSKTCSCCGYVKSDLKLSDRIYKCDKCGIVIDRDFNAALNLQKYTG